MKACAVCHLQSDPYTRCCPACGEASWLQLDEAAEVPTVRTPSSRPGPVDQPAAPLEDHADRRRQPPRRGARQRPS